MRTLIILLSFALLPSCASDAPAPASTLRPDEEEQGRYLLGNVADDLAAGGWHFAVGLDATIPGVGAVTVSVVNGALIASDAHGLEYSGDDLEDMSFADQNGVPKLRIRDAATGPTRYELEYSSNGIDWDPYCDPTVDRYALPFAGRWSLRRYHAPAQAVTFGCVHSGVTAKCVDWGYPGSDDPTSSAWKHHQACTEMANATYCDNGVPHTRELTPIVIRDFIPGAKPDATAQPMLPILKPTDASWPPADEFYFEAAWKEYGPAICLSRLRWASLPTGGYCPNDLPDPRVSDDARAVYCDDLTVNQLAGMGARFVNGSLPMDLALRRWRHSNGNLVTTVAGYIDEATTIVPFRNYTTYVGDDGILLRNLPGSLSASDVIEVFEQESSVTGDRVTAPLSPMGTGVTKDHVIGAREGYLFNTQRPGTIAFNMYRNGDDYVSAIANPGSGFAFVRRLGYVIAP